jgi:peptidoglycan/LPS O-acetylase OafA/YrhL
VAVIGVILYHGNPAQFAQGWLGVDVFFVISGFVIAPKLFEIWSNTNDKKRAHKLLKFYESRVIRLAPTFAFTVVVFGSLLYLFSGWSEIRHFSAQALAASLGLGNLEAINQSQSNYFRPNPKAFLHTWSLSVEAQIYLLAPFLFLMIARSSRKLCFILAVSGAALILQLFIENFTSKSVIVSGRKPEINSA